MIRGQRAEDRGQKTWFCRAVGVAPYHPARSADNHLSSVFCPLSSERGFTMVELITVIVILGILAAIAAPRFFDRNVFDSRGFYDQVKSTVSFAQKAAIAQRRFVCVAFTSNSVTLTTGATTACGTDLTGPTGTAPYTVSSSNASFTGSPTDFNFDALGKPSFAQSITVSGYTTAITVQVETGYVH